MEHHILHVQAELDNEADELDDDSDSFEDLACLSAELFPEPPSASGSTSTSTSGHAFKSTKSVISLNSAYAPELRMSRLGPLPSGSTFVAGPGSYMHLVTIGEQFECPLCLENEMDIASLPCGHVFGYEYVSLTSLIPLTTYILHMFSSRCIHKTILSDPRCPLCRRPADIRNIRRVQPDAQLTGAPQ